MFAALSRRKWVCCAASKTPLFLSPETHATEPWISPVPAPRLRRRREGGGGRGLSFFLFLERRGFFFQSELWQGTVQKKRGKKTRLTSSPLPSPLPYTPLSLPISSKMSAEAKDGFDSSDFEVLDPSEAAEVSRGAGGGFVVLRTSTSTSHRLFKPVFPSPLTKTPNPRPLQHLRHTSSSIP